MSSLNLITIDGPAASGKSSVSRLVAKKLSWPWVSTGAFYRGLAYVAIARKTDQQDVASLKALVSDSSWQVEMTPENTLVYLDDADVTLMIGGEKVGAVASQISQIPEVREALLKRQRDCFNQNTGLVAEGRDCGTVVFPEAGAKVFLTASPALRARRRSDEDTQDIEKTMEMQKERDALDSSRKTAPLKQADGALHIDSSFLSLDEVVAEVLSYARAQNIANI